MALRNCNSGFVSKFTQFTVHEWSSATFERTGGEPMRFIQGSAVNSGKHELFGGFVASAVAILLVSWPVAVNAAAKKKPASVIKEVQGEQRALHALNRLTFGARPGDVAAVQAMGLDKWFEQQLDPSSIDDSALEVRLAMFPAMKLQQVDLMRRYPNPAVLQMMIQTNAALPADPVEYAIYRDSIAFYKMVRAKQEAAKADAGAGKSQGGMAKSDDGSTTLPGDAVDPATPAMVAHEEQLYSGLDA